MDELGDAAYTIGIRLALEDGVTAGMAALAAEMAGVARMVGAMPGFGSAAAALAVAQVGAGQMAVAPVVAEAVPQGPAAVVEREVAGPVVVRHAVERVVEQPVVGRPVAERMMAPVMAAAPPVAPVVRVEQAASVAPVGFEEIRPVAVAPGAVATPPRMLAPVVLPLERSAAPVGVQAGFGASSVSGTAAAGASGGEFSPSPSEPGGWAPGVAAVLPQVAPVAAAPAESSGGGGPVYLDGRLLGHWLSEHLAREAGRPMGGGVGFDGRMGPAWPGALQGG